MSRKNLVCVILSVIGVAYIIFCSVFLEKKARTVQTGSSRNVTESRSDQVTQKDSEPGKATESVVERWRNEDKDIVPPSTDEESSQPSADDVSGDNTAAAETEGEQEPAGSFFQKLAAHQNVRILVIGDSIGLGIGASDEINRWDHLLKNYLEKKYKSSVNIKNESFGGCPSYGIYVKLKSLAERSSNYDMIIVCCGQNDQVTGFSEIYEALLRNIHIAFPSASVMCILESSQKEMTEKMVAVQSLAEYYGEGVVDMISPFAADYDSLVDNGFYPNDEGQKLYCRAISDIIDPLAETGNGIRIGLDDSAGIPEPVNPLAPDYDIMSFYPAGEFVRTDEVSFTLEFPHTDSEGRVQEPFSGMLGIEMSVPNGEYPVLLEVDGLAMGETNIINYTDQAELRYYNFGFFEVGKSIRIVFQTKEAADCFSGLYASTAQE